MRQGPGARGPGPVALVALLISVAPVVAQETDTVVRRDTTLAGPEGTRPRSLTPDSLNPDSLRPALPYFGAPPGPQPAGRRTVFSGDDIKWTGAMSLGELLMHVPGAWAVRAGWFGTPEMISYAGQGSASIEIYWDGFLLQHVGADSLGFDTGQFDIGMFERIEVEVLPTILRVYLISDTPRERRPRTEVSFSTGDASTNAYRIRYMNRYAGGFGIALGVTYFGTEGPRTSPGEVTGLGLWGKATYTPSSRSGVEYQMFRAGRERAALSATRPGFTGDIAGLDGSRTDHFLRAFASTEEHGMGWRMDAVFGATSYSDSSGLLDTGRTQASLEGSFRRRHLSASLLGRLRDSGDPLEMVARGSMSPLPFLTVTAAVRRRGAEAGGYGLLDTDLGASFTPMPWLYGRATMRWRRQGDSAVTGVDTVQRAADWSVGGGVRWRMLELDAGLGRHEPFDAPPFGHFPGLLVSNTRSGATTLEVSYRFTPIRPVTFSGWWRHQLEDSLVAFEPLHQAVNRLTFRSMFLPTFRRGAFDFM
ncbi:MAG TPA: TonB-dependent receptor plug domain-containing protein, partial [Reyranella sp.]|nr:TonB-dependent receptor plug domain-containing protein [Reyranella sp.]